jgi:anti-anti-sigma factor
MVTEKNPYIIEKYSGYLICRLKANLYSDVIVDLRRDIQKEAGNIPWVVFDLMEVKYLYSAALGFIAFLKKYLQEKGTELCLINVNEDLEFLFTSIGFNNMVKVYKNEKSFLSEAKIY